MISGLNSIYNDQLVPRLTRWVMNRSSFAVIRENALKDTEGIVLEVGFGSGLNLPFYSPKVERLIAIEPSEVARKLAETNELDLEFIGLTGEAIPLPDNSVDQVVTTWTLCSIPDVHKALSEFLRVLKPGGKYIFAEHGLSPDAKTARWQHRLTPLQKRLAGGCHLNRPIEEVILSAGFKIKKLQKYYMEGPKVAAFIYQGVAVKEF